MHLSCTSCQASADGPMLDVALPAIGWRRLGLSWWCRDCLRAALERLRATPDPLIAHSDQGKHDR